MVSRISRALVTALAWAVTWLPIGLLIGFIVDRDGSMDEPWIAVGTFPGFLCGAVFGLVTGMAIGRRTLDALSLPRAGFYGAMSGLLVGVVWVAVAVASDPPKWAFELSVIGAITVLSAISGVVTALVARVMKSDVSANTA
jgi:hypothetical protein